MGCISNKDSRVKSGGDQSPKADVQRAQGQVLQATRAAWAEQVVVDLFMLLIKETLRIGAGYPM